MHTSARCFLVLATLVALGCGNSSDDLDVHTEQHDGGTGGASGSGGVSGTGGEAGGGTGGVTNVPPDVLCDGSSDIRLGVTISGGFEEPAYEFTNPYGVVFLFVDGQCRYWASNWWERGVFEGTLDDAAARDLVDRSGWNSLSMWSSHVDEGCPDVGQVTFRSPDAAASCACGCDDDAPPGMDAAFTMTTDNISDLADAGAPFAGAVRILVIEASDVPLGSTSAWPLDWDLAPFAASLDGVTDFFASSVLIEDLAEAAELRELRRFTLEDTFKPSVVVMGRNGGQYELYIRDELPAEVDAAITAFTR